MEGFLAPYRGVNYHQNDFGGRNPEGAREQFNFAHASMRNVVERIIGNVKMKWAILRGMNRYSPEIQSRLVIATCALYNYVRVNDVYDPEIRAAQFGPYTRNENHPLAEVLDEQAILEETQTMAATRDHIADRVRRFWRRQCGN